MNVLGISCYYHDSAAVLMSGDTVAAAAAEERFSRKKHDNNFPVRAIQWCLEWTNLKSEDIDIVAFYEKPLVKLERVLAQHVDVFPRGMNMYIDNIGSWLSMRLRIRETLKREIGFMGRTVFVPHHVSHAASTYYFSGFEKAAIVTIDGVGEWATTTMGLGFGRKITLQREIRFPHSLGLLYSTITAYLGFRVNNSEYKVMGYAAYGSAKTYEKEFSKLITLHKDGSFALNMKYFSYTWSGRMYNKELERLFGLPTRQKESGVQKEYADIAAGLQHTLETAVFHLLNAAYLRNKTKNLCLSGGVALNSAMNGKILSNTPFTNFYIPPDPGDAGGAMGACAYAYVTETKTPVQQRFFPNLGPSYPTDQIADILDAYSLSFTRVNDEKSFLDEVSAYLTNNKVVAWFQGRMEWGPRALGFRSILASAGTAEMKDIINIKIKHRELFRPFAPVILDRYVNTYFHADRNRPESAKYMLMVYPFKPTGIKRVPATVHVDNTGRLQVIERKDNPLYYDLIEAFRKKTGTPAILNTSFNVRGEPIVMSPRDAVECFLKTDIDYLVIDRFIVRKNHA